MRIGSSSSSSSGSINDMNNSSDTIAIHTLWFVAQHLIENANIIGAIRCLSSLLPDSNDLFTSNNNNSNQILLLQQQQHLKSTTTAPPSLVTKPSLNHLEESITRIKLAELLIEHTTNFHETRYHLEKAAMVLDESSVESIELLCKISSYLIDLFYQANVLNLSKQWIKKGIKYSLLEANIFVKENQPSLAFQSIDNAIKVLPIMTQQPNMVTSGFTSNDQYDPMTLLYFNAIKIHFSLLYWDYSRIDSSLQTSLGLFNDINYRLIQYNNSKRNGNNSNNTNQQQQQKEIEYLFKSIFQQNSTNLFSSLSNQSLNRYDLLFRDAMISKEKMTIYFNLLYILYLMRIGEFKAMEEKLLKLRESIVQHSNWISMDTRPPNPIFSFTDGSPDFEGKYLDCLYYLFLSIYLRTVGQYKQSINELSTCLFLLNGQLESLVASADQQSQLDIGKKKSSSKKGGATKTIIHNSTSIKSILRMIFISYENIFYSQISIMDLDSSLTTIKQIQLLISNYPTLYVDIGENTLYTLSSIYLQSISQYQLSNDFIHFALTKSSRFDTQILSIIRLVISTILLNNFERVIINDESEQIIKEYLLPLETHPQLLFRTSFLLLDAIISIHKYNTKMDGSLNRIKQELQECLNTLNKSFNNSQMIINVLCTLASLYLPFKDRVANIDVSVQTLLNTSLSLCTISEDLLSTIGTLQLKSAMSTTNQYLDSNNNGQPIENVQEIFNQLNYYNQKRFDLLQRNQQSAIEYFQSIYPSQQMNK
ncbi:hypothetical protein DFA_08875 [Cavenderia fasciculata]|uniref:Uncharacterized protein n=1 Tax=Cavenderia fasciculata TaxID=261658 RepID=F4Q4S8_CACFS|nr:uncharacterized protein DFA_08875 [Cavenderia fasciculata]EGG17874.1 hypothetical protein DFA_08875 [Cavenderia fasciculata]|eukprot:XP_004356358.1 hypothetical protein DFA_08875 [Cavenderia fasciculata]